MAPTEREVKFQETLRELLERSKATVTQKKLASALGVRGTTVSHYITGRIKPSFETLIGIAAFFNVTLDYLVFGESARRPVEEGTHTVRADVVRALMESNAYNSRQRDLIVRVNRRLFDEIERVTARVLEDRENLGPSGFFTDAESMAIETCAVHTRIMIRAAPADLEVGANGDVSPGAYFETLVNGILAGHSYQFLFYGKRGEYAPYAQAYRDLLSRADVPLDVVHEQLGFRVIDTELPSGFGIHELDVAKLERLEPILWERFREHGIVNGTLAYASVRHEDALGGIVLYGTYFDSALRMFTRDWDIASAL
jgi:transcriptional regulator with XRE-family HTH domain